MVELTLLKYIIHNADEILLTQLDGERFLDTQAKSYLKLIKDNKERSGKILTESDLELLANTQDIFKDIKLVSEAGIIFFIEQLHERYNKYNFFNELYDSLQRDSSFEETIDEVQSIILKTGKQTSGILDIDCSELQDNSEDFIIRKPLGFGKYDEVNKGLGISEMALLGGHRGSGKSILALHSALTRFKSGDTVAFISIEMRSNEVAHRLDAMVTGLPIKAIQFNELQQKDYPQYYYRKALTFCRNVDKEQFLHTTDKKKLTELYKSLPKKDNKFFLYDLPTCTLTDIAFIVQKLKKTQNLKYIVVDYLNIIKVPNCDDPIGWKTQLQRAEGLKGIAREYDIAVLSPMQTDEDNKVKFAKAIEDPVDLSLIFKKAKVNETGSTKLALFTSKIRGGYEVDFDLYMNKTNLTIHSSLEGLC